MKLYVDDIREAPDESWTLVRTIGEAVRFMVRFQPEIDEISIDHDISHEVRIDSVYRPFPSPETYQPLAYVIGLLWGGNATTVVTRKPRVVIHSSNPLGSEEMRSIMAMYGVWATLEPMGAAYRPK